MKNLLIILILGVAYADANANSQSLSTEMNFCEDIGWFLNLKISHGRQAIPTSWDEIEPISRIRDGAMKRDAYLIKSANSFALVPGAPSIREQQGISRSYYGNRLFLISREETSIRTGARGRCVILIRPEGLNSKPLQTFSYFVPEVEAQLILKQIPGFDPKKQPIAFNNLFIYQNRSTIKGDQLSGLISKLEKSPPFDPADPNALPPPANSAPLWIGGVIAIVLGMLVYLAKRSTSRESNAKS